MNRYYIPLAPYRAILIMFCAVALCLVFGAPRTGQAGVLAGAKSSVTAQWYPLAMDTEARALLGMQDDTVIVGATLTTLAHDGVIYAPFAMGYTQPDVLRVQKSVKTLMLRVGKAEQPPTNAQYYLPPGEQKKDPFSGAEIPVYAGDVMMIVALSPHMAGSTVRLELSGLVCTPKNCTPFRTGNDVLLPGAADGATPSLRHINAEAVRFYRAAPFYPALSAEGDNAAVVGEGEWNAGVVQPVGMERGAPVSAAVPAGEGAAFAAYAEALSPQYFQAGLEVTSLWKAIALGLAAGLVLNVMPCVLPVITLKLGTLAGLGGWASLMGDAPAARQGRRRFRVYGLGFSLGIFTWFALLFILLGSMGFLWGQMFQSPTVVLVLTFVLFVLALSLVGLVKIPPLKIKGGQGSSLAGQAFCSGLLATLMATPCSGPLLGGVLGWAVSQSAWYLGFTLLSVAVGMALPFLLVAVKPGLGARLPKPGMWNIKLEMVMGFLLLGTVIYFLTLLPQDFLPRALVAMLLLTFAAWLWKWAPRKQRFGLSRGAACVALLAAMALPFWGEATTVEWERFDAERFVRLAGTEPLLVDFTADWCINCKVVEGATLTPKRLAAAAERYGLKYIKVDLTHSNPDGEALLHALGSASIPLIAIFPPHAASTPLVLRDMVTPGQLDAALQSVLPPRK